MKSFRRSNENPVQEIRAAHSMSRRAVKRAALQHQIAWRAVEDADARWRADMRHNVPGTPGLPPSMMR